jgi:hypothetical protein
MATVDRSENKPERPITTTAAFWLLAGVTAYGLYTGVERGLEKNFPAVGWLLMVPGVLIAAVGLIGLWHAARWAHWLVLALAVLSTLGALSALAIGSAVTQAGPYYALGIIPQLVLIGLTIASLKRLTRP